MPDRRYLVRTRWFNGVTDGLHVDTLPKAILEADEAYQMPGVAEVWITEMIEHTVYAKAKPKQEKVRDAR